MDFFWKPDLCPQPAMSRLVCGSVTLRSNCKQASTETVATAQGEEPSPDHASQEMKHLVAMGKKNIKRLTLKKPARFHQHQINLNPSS